MKLNLIVNAVITLNLHYFNSFYAKMDRRKKKKIKNVIDLVGLPSLLFMDKT